MSSHVADRPVLRPAANNIAPRTLPSPAFRKPKASPPNSPSKPSSPKTSRKTHFVSKTHSLGSDFAKEAEPISDRLVQGSNLGGEISIIPTSKVPSKSALSKSSPTAGEVTQKPKCKTPSLEFSLSAARKAAAMDLQAQKKLRIAEYGRVKSNKASMVAPELINLTPASVELKRCKFITPQSDPVHIAYHDEEWGVPVHDDRLLFELLVLVGVQVELSWPTILRKRGAYRAAFAGFDPATVAKFTEKQIAHLEADSNLTLHGAKIRGIVENAKRILEIMEEWGCLERYIWGFVNGKAMNNRYRYARQVPVKTSKSEWMSKELVRRGFRFVGPTIMYSFMQAAGLCNDHLTECFRHHQCFPKKEDN